LRALIKLTIVTLPLF